MQRVKSVRQQKGVRLLCKLQAILPRRSLLINYKSYTRPHHDSGDVIYDQLANVSFSNIKYNFESVQI